MQAEVKRRKLIWPTRLDGSTDSPFLLHGEPPDAGAVFSSLTHQSGSVDANYPVPQTEPVRAFTPAQVDALFRALVVPAL
jgi:hypothetical protein